MGHDRIPIPSIQPKVKIINDNEREKIMTQKVYLVEIAKNANDFYKETHKGLQLAMICEKAPNKDMIRAYLEATLDAELRKQHIPLEGKTTQKKQTRRNELKTNYIDLLNSVNNTHYTVKEVTA